MWKCFECGCENEDHYGDCIECGKFWNEDHLIAEDESMVEKVTLNLTLRIEHNKELQLMDVLDQVMEHYHGIGVGVTLVNGDETRRALDRFNEKWMPSGFGS